MFRSWSIEGVDRFLTLGLLNIPVKPEEGISFSRQEILDCLSACSLSPMSRKLTPIESYLELSRQPVHHL